MTCIRFPEFKPEWVVRARKAHKKRGLSPAEIKKLDAEIRKAEVLVTKLHKRRGRCAHPIESQIVDLIENTAYLYCNVCLSGLGSWVEVE